MVFKIRLSYKTSHLAKIRKDRDVRNPSQILLIFMKI